MMQLVMLLCAAVAALCAFIALGSAKRMKKQAIRTQAVVTGMTVLGGGGQRQPEVTFTHTDGRTICYPAQRHGSFRAGVGDQVDIVYTGRKVLGAESWNIFILPKPNANPFAVYTFGSAVLLAAAVVFAVIAMVM